MKKSVMASCVALLLTAMWIVPGAAAPVKGSSTHRLMVHSMKNAPAHSARSLTFNQRRALRQGYLVPNQRVYKAQKAAAARRAGRRAASPARRVGSLAPVTGRSWEGIKDPSSTPSDSTGAIGTQRYIETVNSKVAIYNRTSNTPLSTSTLNSLVGSGFGNVFDPQIMWDGQTSRFYYAADDIESSSDNLIVFGFSKTATPTGPADFCKYSVTYGSNFPDYPKLGDTKNFLLIGSNVFGPSNFLGSDILYVSKPAAGTTCPSPSTFTSGDPAFPLHTSGGALAFTPVPAQQVDGSTTGWAVARPISVPTGGATSLQLFKATENGTGGVTIQQNGTSVPVTAYKVPPNAPQSGTTFKIDTSDTRPTQAISAKDPSKGSAVALWTQHTVSGGAGAEVRWYEINVGAANLFRHGKSSSSSVYNFNGAISPDRKVNGATKAFGSDMVLNFNTSSSSTFPAIKMISKRADASASSPVLIKQSPGFDADFGCNSSRVCRWGDYAAATPDPAASASAAVGVVWSTSMWNVNSVGNENGTNWRTWNWSATP